MGNAGYGNHEPPPVSARGGRADPNAASQKPPAASPDRPGMNLGGAGEVSSATGQMGGSRSTPDPSGQGPGERNTGSPGRTDGNTDEARAPGTGALGTNPQGDEVDPGTS
jgi:hypothetical protein